MALQQAGPDPGIVHRLTAAGLVTGLGSGPMSSKYYAHFTAPGAMAQAAGEWAGVVELTVPLRSARERQELELVLACSLDLDIDDVQVLEWSRLH